MLKMRNVVLGSLGVAAALAGQLAQPSGAAPAPASGPNVQSATGDALTKAVQAQRGKPVLVNLWATWCEPCVAEYPDLVKLHNAYKGKGLVVLSISTDEPEDRTKVVEFVRKQKATFPVYVRGKGSLEQFIAPLDKKWNGAVPTTYIFNRNGKLVGAPLMGLRTYAQLEAAIKPALK